MHSPVLPVLGCLPAAHFRCPCEPAPSLFTHPWPCSLLRIFIWDISASLSSLGVFMQNVYVLSFALRCDSAQKMPIENLSGRWVLDGLVLLVFLFEFCGFFFFFEDEHLHYKSDLCIHY